MSTLRDDLQPVVDEARGIVDELGFRTHEVVVRIRTWTGGEIDCGVPVDVDRVLSPTPKVTGSPPSWAHAEPGRWEDGDRWVTRISRAYTLDDLGLGAPTKGTEVLWLLCDGESEAEYIAQGHPDRRPLEWRVHLKRRKGRTRARG